MDNVEEQPHNFDLDNIDNWLVDTKGLVDSWQAVDYKQLDLVDNSQQQGFQGNSLGLLDYNLLNSGEKSFDYGWNCFDNIYYYCYYWDFEGKYYY